MALPHSLRLKGHRTFNYIHKNSRKIYGKYMVLKITRSNPKILISHGQHKNISNFKIAFTISRKVSKKACIRNKIKRKLHENYIKNFSQQYNRVPYWVLVNLKGGDFINYETELLKEFQSLINKTGLLK